LQAVDQKIQFNTIWNQEFKSSKFSGLDSVFDYFYDEKILPWTSAISPFVLDPALPLQVGDSSVAHKTPSFFYFLKNSKEIEFSII
jgi:hypothetical protein